MSTFQHLSALWPLRAYISLYSSCLAVYFSTLLGIVWLVFLADPNGAAYQLVAVRIPALAASASTKVCGAKFTGRMGRLINWVANEQNPLMQIMYLAIVLSAWAAMIFKGYPMIRAGNPFLEPYHCYVGYGVYAACLATFYLACTVPAGTISKNNTADWDVYPPDNVLFAANKWCDRTGMVKLPRSKYSKLEGRHVPRFDHYCVWLKQSVGALNYRYFLVFLLVHALMLTYGAVAAGLILYGRVVKEDLFSIRFYNMQSREYVPASYYVVGSYLTRDDGIYIVGLLLLSGVMGLVMWAFLGFHVYLVSVGKTTNEFFKWQDLKRWHKRATANYKAAKEGKNGWVAGKPFDLKSADYKMTGVTQEMVDNFESIMQQDKDVGCVGATTAAAAEGEEKKVEGNGGEGAAKSYICEDPGPYPLNIYNRGIVENWKEVFFPYRLLGAKIIENTTNDLLNSPPQSSSPKKGGKKGGGGKNKNSKKNA
jgi:palmitoyltransferase